MLMDGIIGHDLMGLEADNIHYEEMDDRNNTRLYMEDALDLIFDNDIVIEAGFNTGVTINSMRYRHDGYSAVKTVGDPLFPGNIMKEIRENGHVIGGFHLYDDFYDKSNRIYEAKGRQILDT
ncbi:hypothetical protein Dimus_025212 [Dionaea muscipula]